MLNGRFSRLLPALSMMVAMAVITVVAAASLPHDHSGDGHWGEKTCQICDVSKLPLLSGTEALDGFVLESSADCFTPLVRASLSSSILLLPARAPPA